MANGGLFFNVKESDSTPWGPVGKLVYTRTYARYLPELKRRERWSETIDRVVRYSQELAPGKVSENEAYFLRYMMSKLWAFPSGRTLWVGGTEHLDYFPQANYNCAFTDLRTSKDFHDLVYLLMSGVGVGYRVTSDNLLELQKESPFRIFPEMILEEYRFVGQDSLLEETQVQISDRVARVLVGDSRDGWSQMVQVFLDLLAGKYGPLEKVYWNFDYVRPLGSRLRRFGGFASGPEPLMDFIKESYKIILQKRAWDSTLAMDLADLIGRMVVAGGTRRSALIALGDDEEFAKAKIGSWWETHPWRAQSNNSLMFDRKPSRSELGELFRYVMEYGEPGFVNETQARNRRENFRGLNPCAEILLDSGGFCNLATINLRDVPLDLLDTAARVLVRHSIRINLHPLPAVLDRWQKVRDRDMLIGISLTGVVEAMEKYGWSYDGLRAVLRRLRNLVHEEAIRYSEELGVRPPLLSTTIKPEGTLSLLPGVSHGVHPPYAPYYLRRIRINAVDPVAKALVEAGATPHPDYPGVPLEESRVWVFEFPVAATTKRSEKEWTALEQLELYKLMQEEWTDHNTSITVKVGQDEVEEVVDWLHENWDSYVAVSFLPKVDGIYYMAPQEEISREEYLERTRKIDPGFWNRFQEALDWYESGGSERSDDDDLSDPSCANGVCPVR